MDEQKKMTKKTQYNIQYAREKIKRVPLDMQLSAYEELKAAADTVGEKVNTYIKKAITERMERDRTGGVPSVGETDRDTQAEDTEATDDGAGFPYSSDEDHAPQPAVGVSPMEDEESSPAEHQDLLSPDEWAEWAHRRDDEPMDDWQQRLNRSNRRISLPDIAKRLGALSKDEQDLLMGCDPESLERFRQREEQIRQRMENEARHVEEDLPF